MRERADILVVRQGLADSHARAQALILAGAILDERDQRIDKPGQLLDLATTLKRKGQRLKYVSRGGLKLEAALDAFAVDPAGCTCLDVGASTGGFTDCLLQRGAAKVYAVDVGYGQIAWSLRQDPRVVVIERCNIRTAPDELLPEPVDLIVFDLSFISLRVVLERALRFAKPVARLVALVKPQFEVGRERVGKGGIVRDAAAREEVVAAVGHELTQLGLTDVRHIVSPIQGADGNIEFLIQGRRG